MVSAICVSAQGKLTVEFKAKGCCPMCETRIIDALDVPGVRVAEWDQAKELVRVVYKPKKITAQALEQLVADSGHDTDNFQASDEVYDGLADCCKYRNGCAGCSHDEGEER